MEASEPKWVNTILITNGVNSLRLEGLQLKVPNAIYQLKDFHLGLTSRLSQFPQLQG